MSEESDDGHAKEPPHKQLQGMCGNVEMHFV